MTHDDCCTQAHALGYDVCPLCGPLPEPLPPATPEMLLYDLEGQLRQCQYDGGQVPRYALAVWITMLHQARVRLAEKKENKQC